LKKSDEASHIAITNKT